MASMFSIANADVIQLFPDGDFDHPTGPSSSWVETSGGGTVLYTYPTTGGNPNGCGVIDTTSTNAAWGIWVGGNTTPVPIAPLGLVAGNTYNFVQDMKSLVDGDGKHPPGLKIESWGPNGKISDSGDMPPDTDVTADWATYTFPYTIAGGATGIKIVPLWYSGGKVAYDNFGVIVPPTPLAVSIMTPGNSDSVSTNFTIVATAAVSPGNVTNVAFYDGAKLLTNDNSYPYSLSVKGADLGIHILTVVAQDDTGHNATSDVVYVSVEGLAPPPLTYPITTAAAPIWPKSSVISVYNSSATYNDIAPVNWYPWGTTASRGDYQIEGTNAVVKSYLGLNYAGVEVNPSYAPATSLDVSKMTTLHVDVWTTANQFAVQLQSVNGINGNVGATHMMQDSDGIITSNNWVSLDIPLSIFTQTNAALDLTHIDQLLWVDNTGDGVQMGDFYIDNVFFYDNTPVIQSPVASTSNLNLKIASLTGSNYVLQATPALAPASWTSLQTNVGNGKLLNFTVPIAPSTPLRFFRVQQN